MTKTNLESKARQIYQSVAERIDSWANVFTGLGTKGRDKRLSTIYQPDYILDENQLNALYRGDGIARRIVDLTVRELTRKGFKIEGDTDGIILKEFNSIGAMKAVRELLRWSRIHGGAIGVMGLDDSQDLEEPLNEEAFRRLRFITVFDRWRVRIATTDYYLDPNEEKYGKPKLYTVNPIITGTVGADTRFRVHESRVLRMDGEEVPLRVRQNNQGWGDSIYQACYERLRALGSVFAGVELIIEDFYQAIIKIDGLSQLIASGKSSLVTDRLQLLDMSKHIANIQILDENEDYSKHSTTVAGLPQLMDRFVLGLSAATSIPVTLLMGQSPAGLKATGESDIRNWYDAVSALQEDKLTPIVQRIVDLIMKGKDSPAKGIKGTEENPVGAVEWVPLWQLTEEEEAKRRKSVAESDAIYINSGVLDPTEVANSRFGGEVYSAETVLDDQRDLTTPDDRSNAEGLQRMKEKEAELEAAREAIKISKPGGE